MENANRSRKVWRTIKGMGCCGSTWQFNRCGSTWQFNLSEISIREEEEAQDQSQAQQDGEAQYRSQAQQEEEAQDAYTFRDGERDDSMDQGSPPVGRMTLAMALEFDRHWLRAGPRREHRPPLMRLFEETDGQDHSTIKWYNDSGVDGLCCVCMERNKEAAFISCGHTYCRPCATELWINRGSCPLCNRSIDDVLYIY